MPTDSRADYDAVASEITASSFATTEQMFGMPCLKNEGKAFAGYYQGAMVFKLKGQAHAEALALSGARLFDPSSHGRPMKEWGVPIDNGRCPPSTPLNGWSWGGKRYGIRPRLADGYLAITICNGKWVKKYKEPLPLSLLPGHEI
jgi:hypothetical protein